MRASLVLGLVITVTTGLAEPHSPPRGGGEAAPLTKCREATEAAQTEWSDRQAFDFVELTTPARQLLLSCRATPPLRGGEFSLSLRSTHSALDARSYRRPWSCRR